jgi:hypothetical protein
MPRTDPPPDTGPPAGVADETLLDLLAALTPEERLRWNDRAAATIGELRHGFAAAEPHDAARAARGERD